MIESIGFASLLGVISVMQAGLNKRVADHLGLSFTALLNNSVLLFVTLLLIGIFFHSAAVPSLKGFKAIYFLPGVLGIFLVAGIPLAISHYGATRVFLPLIGSQILFSLLWDRFLEGAPIKPIQIVGSLLAFVGSVVASL